MSSDKGRNHYQGFVKTLATNGLSLICHNYHIVDFYCILVVKTWYDTMKSIVCVLYYSGNFDSATIFYYSSKEMQKKPKKADKNNIKISGNIKVL
jgi:hypothetical protein